MNRTVANAKKRAFLTIVLVLIAIIFVVMVFGEEEEDDYDDYPNTSYEDEDNDYYGNNGNSGSVVNGGDEDDDTNGNNTTTPSVTARSHYVNTSSAQNATMFIYMIGSDLESNGGAATSDIEEMIQADYGDGLQIILITGGAKAWQSNISENKRQIWCIDDNGIQLVKELKQADMTKKSALVEFLSYGLSNYAADRNMLVFWDHGGGTKGGFGYDENYETDGLTLKDLSDAIAQAGTKFDFIGFDACLMATIETAYALEPYADYLIASEEYEPGDGWYYTNFLTKLANKPNMDTVTLGKAIIDDFSNFYGNEDVTLSITDLACVNGVYEALGDFLAAAEKAIKADNSKFKVLSNAKSKAREYCDGEIDQVDMIDMINRTSFNGKNELVQAVRSCVKYCNKSTLTGSNGLAMYFPAKTINDYKTMRSMLNSIDFTTPTEYYNYFLSIMAGGKTRNRSMGGNTVASANEDKQDYTGEDWYSNADESAFQYGDEYGELELKEINDEFVLDKPDSFYDQINDIRLAVMLDDGDCYLDLGEDNLASFDDEGRLLMDFDYYWVAINEQIVPFYANPIDDDGQRIIFSGKVFALLNGETEIEMVLEWDPVTGDSDADSEGHVKGYRIVNNNTETVAKGLKKFQKGDRITFLCDTYDIESGEFLETIEIGDEIKVTSQEALKVTNEELADYTVLCWYVLTDIYGKELSTEVVEITLE